jgi:hypothetical protein
MRRSVVALGLAVALAAAGCFGDGKTGLFKSGGAFNTSSQPESPETVAVQKRTAALGKRILEANTQLDKRVAFLAAGRTQPEIFHRTAGDATEIWVTNGLVDQCKTDGQLAAVLCQELGRVTAEKMAREAARRAVRDDRPPPPLHFGNEPAGPNDPLYARQLADADRRRQENAAIAAGLPPETLARGYLRASGFSTSDYDAVVPLLRQAEQNDTCAQQILGKTPGLDKPQRPLIGW